MQLNALIGKKSYQKQGFLQDGTRVPLTGVVVAGNIVTQIKTQDKEGYNSIQLGISAKKKANKAILGHVKNATQASKNTSKDKETQKPTNITPKYFKEVRIEDVSDIVLGSEVNVAEVFEAGDMIDVTGVSKGKGWAGGVKRYGFRGGPKTHGQSDRHRAPGSIGQGTTPGRVYKGKRMAGRMGSDTVTVKNLEVVEITDDGVLLIRGLVPGRVNGLLLVKKVGQNKKFVPLYKEVVEKPAEEEVISEKTSEAKVEPVETPKVNDEVASDTTQELKEESKQEDVAEESKLAAEKQEVEGDTKEENKEPKQEEVKEEVSK